MKRKGRYSDYRTCAVCQTLYWYQRYHALPHGAPGTKVYTGATNRCCSRACAAKLRDRRAQKVVLARLEGQSLPKLIIYVSFLYLTYLWRNWP
jgi:hypothetical protein